MCTVYDPTYVQSIIHSLPYTLSRISFLSLQQPLLFLLSNDSALNFVHINVILYNPQKKSSSVKSGMQGSHRIEPSLPTPLPCLEKCGGALSFWKDKSFYNVIFF
jgi:hypothetical protein